MAALKKITLIILASLLIAALAISLIANRPRDASPSCRQFYSGMDNPPAAALECCAAGGYFS
jgi:hypothetical protein